MKSQINLTVAFSGILILTSLVLVPFGLPSGNHGTTIEQENSQLAIITPGPDLKPFDKPESYGPDTLWEKINGQAEFYLPAGFNHCQNFIFCARSAAQCQIQYIRYVHLLSVTHSRQTYHKNCNNHNSLKLYFHKRRTP